MSARMIPAAIAAGVLGILAARIEAAEVSLKPVGLCYTGFGVPGSGKPFVLGDRVLVNAGEGYPTVIDAADPRRPRVLRHIPTWFFTTHIYPLAARDLVYLSSSRGPLLVLRGLKEMAARGDVTEIPWDEAWGPSFLSGIRDDGIAYTVAGEDILVLDLNDPEKPKELAKIHQPRLAGHGRERPSELLAMTPGCRRGALVVDGGKQVLLLDFETPTRPRFHGDFENVKVADDDGKVAWGRVLAMDDARLVLGHPESTSEYWRSVKLTFWDIRDADRPKRASDMTFDASGTHLRDIVLDGPRAFAVDGREIESGHGVSRTQRSRLYVLDLADLTAPKILADLQDSMPTEYSRATLVGRTLYVNDYNYGLWCFDVGDPVKPVKLGGVPTSAEGHWLYLAGDHAYVAHTFGGTIHVINVADPTKPQRVGYYWDGQWLNYKAKIRGRGRAMYVPQFDGLAIVDIDRPAEPRRAGEFLDAEGRPLAEPCIDLTGPHAFVTTAPPAEKAAPRLLVYDVTRPLGPQCVGATDLPGDRGFRILASGKMLYLVAYTGGRIVAVDASDPRRPKIAAELRGETVTIGGKPYSLAIDDNGGNGAPGLAVAGRYLYVVTGKPAPEPYLLIFDVQDPSAIRPAGVFAVDNRQGWQYFICDAIVDGNRLFLGDYGCDEIYDIADPLKPRRLAEYRRSYAWQVGTLRDKRLYVPKLDGLEILEVMGD